MKVCLFCKGSGPFSTKEHIVPESLGNDSDIVDFVCDKCQNYLSREVEKLALEKTPIAFWRTYLGIKTKKGKLPHVNLKQPKSSFLPSFHPYDDEISLQSEADGNLLLPDISREFFEKINKGKRSINLVITPWRASVIGRFLAKMGLEYLASIDYDLALSAQFDEIRRYVRLGVSNSLWPFYQGSYGTLEDLFSPIKRKAGEWQQEVSCYQFSIGTTTDENEYIFAFKIGTDLYLICLSHNIPKKKFEEDICDIHLNCIYYPRESWMATNR